ncbi:MAG: S8 family serine peptidase [Saprospiraceae bacterium]|nr:S8 family serine peptidase [Saprospiraceae bacterium]
MKPDISAPGQGVLSSVPSGGFAFFNGTSMAGPHVAGVVALIISANPLLAGRVDAIENIIKETAQPYTTAQNCGNSLGGKIPNHAYGYGRIDAFRAVERALLFTTSVKNDVKNASIKAFPNPFEQNFTLNTEGVEGATTVEIFNINGQLILPNEPFFIKSIALSSRFPTLRVVYIFIK